MELTVGTPAGVEAERVGNSEPPFDMALALWLSDDALSTDGILREATVDMKLCLLLLLCALAFNADAACKAEGPVRVDARLTIDLQKQLVDGIFYYRTGQFAIVVDPAPLTRELAKHAKAGVVIERLLRDVRSTPPGGEPKDLFALALKNPDHLRFIEKMLADLLERGEASVIDVFYAPNEPNRYLSQTVLFKLSSDDPYVGRQFCTPDGHLVFEVIDLVA